jgi:hypothetical protein
MNGTVKVAVQVEFMPAIFPDKRASMRRGQPAMNMGDVHRHAEWPKAARYRFQANRMASVRMASGGGATVHPFTILSALFGIAFN